jgi:hypothetical protein
MALVGELFIELTRATLLHRIGCVCSLANLAQAERNNLMTHIAVRRSDGQKPHIDLGVAPTLTRGFVGQHRRDVFSDEKRQSQYRFLPAMIRKFTLQGADRLAKVRCFLVG